MNIRLATERDRTAWDAYVYGHPQGAPFHLTAWRDVIEQTFGHDPRNLIAVQGHEVLGVLPLTHVKSLLFGSILVSSAFAVYGGALADDAETARALEQEAVRLADRLGVDYVEFRDREVKSEADGETKNLYFTFRRALPDSAEEVISWVPRKSRRMVRLGIKAGLTGELTRSARGVDEFYDLFSLNLRTLGTPAVPKSIVTNLLRSFGDEADILLIREGRNAVAGVVNRYFRDQVLPYYSGSIPDINRVGGNNFLYYDLACKGIDRGFRVFDFGRSKLDTGPYHFKRHFGFDPEPLPYRYHLIRADKPPELNPNNPKYALAIDLWKKLPLGVTTALGPWIVKGIP